MKRNCLSAYAGLPREVYFLFAARLVNAMGSFITPLLTLILTQKFDLSKSTAGGLISLLILTEAPCLILGGKLADSVGRKKVLVLCSLAGALFYVLCGLLPLNLRAIVFLVAASDCYTMAYPAFSAMLADLTGAENRRQAFSLLYFGTNIGMAVSPVIGGLLFKDHLQLLFLLDAATTVGYIAVIARNVPETFRRAQQNEQAPGTDAGRHSLFGVLKRAPVLVLFVLLLFFYDFCYSQWSFLLPAQFGDWFGRDSARMFSILSSANAVTVILLTPAATFFSRRLRPLTAVAAGGFLYSAAFLGFAFGRSFAAFFFFAELFTLGEILTTIQVEAFVTGHAPADCRGRVTAFENFVRGSANALGPLAMGFALTALPYRGSWLLTAGIVLAGGIGMLLLERKDRREIPG